MRGQDESTVEAWHFVDRRRQSGEMTGHGLISLRVHYASLALHNNPNVIRGLADLEQWRGVAEEVCDVQEHSFLPAGSATAALLLGALDEVCDLQLAIRFLTAVDGGAMAALDYYLDSLRYAKW